MLQAGGLAAASLPHCRPETPSCWQAIVEQPSPHHTEIPAGLTVDPAQAVCRRPGTLALGFAPAAQTSLPHGQPCPATASGQNRSSCTCRPAVPPSERLPHRTADSYAFALPATACRQPGRGSRDSPPTSATTSRPIPNIPRKSGRRRRGGRVRVLPQPRRRRSPDPWRPARHARCRQRNGPGNASAVASGWVPAAGFLRHDPATGARGRLRGRPAPRRVAGPCAAAGSDVSTHVQQAMAEHESPRKQAPRARNIRGPEPATGPFERNPGSLDRRISPECKLRKRPAPRHLDGGHRPLTPSCIPPTRACPRCQRLRSTGLDSQPAVGRPKVDGQLADIRPASQVRKPLALAARLRRPSPLKPILHRLPATSRKPGRSQCPAVTLPARRNMASLLHSRGIRRGTAKVGCKGLTGNHAQTRRPFVREHRPLEPH